MGPIHSKKFRLNTVNILFLTPALLFFIFVIVIPFIMGIGYAFTDWDGVSRNYNFVGISNFLRIFTDTDALYPIKNTLLYAIYTTLLGNLLGLLVALGLNRSVRSTSILRTSYFMPMVISMVLAAFIWRFIFSDVFKMLFSINSLLGSTDTVLWGVIIIGIWRDVGLAMVIYLAGLQSVPRELYEACSIDGAGAIKKFLHITLPLIVPAFTINLTLFLSWNLRVFDIVMAATGGGPGGASKTFAIYIYENSFRVNKAGYGQATAVILMFAVFIISGLIAGILRKKEVEA